MVTGGFEGRIRITAATLQQMKRALPILLTNQAQTYFTNAFKLGRLGPYVWPEVNRRIPDTSEYMYPKLTGLSRRTKPILTLTGDLRRKVNRSVVSSTWENMQLRILSEYGHYHNDGEGQKERPFMKHTKELGNMQEKLIRKNIRTIWREQ